MTDKVVSFPKLSEGDQQWLELKKATGAYSSTG